MARWFVAALLIGAGLVLLLARAPAAATARLNRDLLWLVIKTCAMSDDVFGRPAPCAWVKPGGEGRLGTALLRVPGEATHHVLSPTADISGLEAPRLRGAEGAALLPAALAARAEVVAAAGGRLDLADVGLAINSPLSRSQDHLHIHLDCVAPQTRTALRAAPAEAERWRWLPETIGGRRYLVRRLPAAQIGAANPFVALAEFLPDAALISHSSLAVVQERGPDGGYFLLADVRPNSQAERVLDHVCRLAR